MHIMVRCPLRATFYTIAGAQDRLMQTLTEPNTDIAILISPKSSVGGEWIDWASDNDELVTALSDEDKDLKYQNVETAPQMFMPQQIGQSCSLRKF